MKGAGFNRNSGVALPAIAIVLAIVSYYPGIALAQGKPGSGGECCGASDAASAPASSDMAGQPRSGDALSLLAVENPNHLQMPEQKAVLLLSTACRVVAEEFRISKPTDHPFSMKLVLGSKDEHYTADKDNGGYTLFLERWDEHKFTVAVSNLAIQHLLVRERLASIVNEVQRRMSQVAPVPVTELQHWNGPVQPLAGRSSGCLSAITDAAARNIGCGTH